MSDKELVKEAVKLAEDELKNEEKMRIKSVVKATFELLRQKEEKKHTLDDEIRILRRDLTDLNDGRLDRIKERQDLDPKARDISVIIIKERIIERQVPTPMWYWPWTIEIKPQYVYPVYPTYTVYGSDATIDTSGYLTSTNTTTASANNTVQFTTNNSAVHMHASGTYSLADGSVRYL